MTNEANNVKLVKDVFKDYESKGNILNCEITNVSIFKKSSRLVIDLKSSSKIQIGEKLEFQYYLKSRFKVAEAQINVEEIACEKTSVAKSKSKNDILDENSPYIYGNKKTKIPERIIQVRDVNIDSGRVCICGEVIKQELKELKTRKFSYDGKCI